MKIESKRCVLRRFQISDFPNMRLLETNPSIMKFTPARVPQTETQTRERLESQIAKQPTHEPFGVWAAELKKDGSFLGWFMLLPGADNQLELGFMLVERFWNAGFATEISRSLLEFAKQHAPDKKIVAKTTTDNRVSKRVLEKVGFKYVETKAIPEKALGGEVDVDVFFCVF